MNEFQNELQLRVDEVLLSVSQARDDGDEELAQAYLGELHNLVELAHDHGVPLRLTALTPALT